jgi:hypothetical protein
LAEATTSFPQTAPNVDDVFEPVTWHHQRHPFIRALTCKTGKTCRGVAGGASSDDQVSPVFVRREEKERERERERESIQSSFNNFDTPFLYSCLPYAYFTLVKLKAPRGRFLRWEEYSLTM